MEEQSIIVTLNKHWQIVKQDQFLVLTILFLGLLIPFMPRYIIAPWDNYRFVLMAAFPLSCILSSLFNKDEFQFKFVLTDLGWFLFISICFLSFFWATNPSLIWYQAFGWFALILWMLLFRSFSARNNFKKYLPVLFFALFFVLAIPIVLISLFDDLSLLHRWNHHFGFNINITTITLLCTFPFLIFYQSDNLRIRVLQVLGIILLSYILYFFNKRGSLLALTVVGIYFIWCQFSKKLIKYISWLGLSLLLISLGFCIVNFDFITNKLAIDNLATYSGDSARLYSILCAFNLLSEHSFVGVGLGNWYVDAYKNGLSEISGFDNPFILYRPANHNVYSQYLAELGIIGTVAFLIPVITVLWRGWRYCYQLSIFQKAAFTSLLIYLVAGMVYRDANFYEFHFSGMQLIAFCALGILIDDEQRFFVLPKWGNILLVVTSLIALCGFIYYLNAYYVYQNVLKLAKEKTIAAGPIRQYDSTINYNRVLRGDSKSINLLEGIYHPLFMNNLGFYQDGHQKGGNRSLSLRLAQLYVYNGQNEKAEQYFQVALKNAPNDEYILINYAKFLLRIKQNATKAKIYAKRAYDIQKNNYDFNLLLAEIALVEKEYALAKKYLQIIIGSIVKTYRYDNPRDLMYAEMAIEEKQYDKAKQYLEKLDIKEGQNYSNIVERLQIRLNQTTIDSINIQ